MNLEILQAIGYVFGAVTLIRLVRLAKGRKNRNTIDGLLYPKD